MLSANKINEVEPYFPLKVLVCSECFLVQVDEVKSATEIFNDEYTYFSSFSKSWLAHAEKYVNMMIDRFGLNSNSKVIEIASNDGYLLQYFNRAKVPVLGVEPTGNTAKVAQGKGIETLVEFWTEEFSKKEIVDKDRKGDLILGNNVFAHVPDINDFSKGLKQALNPNGVVTLEFPHLLNLVAYNQFDTIYHEHFSYLSLYSVKKIFNKVGLEIFDVEKLSTHGGSIRIFAKHQENNDLPILKNVSDLLKEETDAGINTIAYYAGFQNKIDQIKSDFLSFLIKAKSEGKKVVGYGAAAKGNTLLNYCGVKGNDFIEYVVDMSPHKQNKHLPGSHIPVLHPDEISSTKPDYIVILPWNLEKEITEQLKFVKEWGAKFAIAIPELRIIE